VPGTLVVVTFGDVRAEWLKALGRAAAALGMTGRGGAALALPKYAFNPERKAFHGAGIFRKLLQAQPLPSEGGVVLGVGALELFTPEAGLVLAEHDRDQSVAVLGLGKLLDPRSDERSARRVQLAAQWVVGRALGLHDCDDRRCALHAPETPESLDGRTGQLCANCQKALANPAAADRPDRDEGDAG